jgi:hypothetical protein
MECISKRQVMVILSSRIMSDNVQVDIEGNDSKQEQAFEVQIHTLSSAFPYSPPRDVPQ